MNLKIENFSCGTGHSLNFNQKKRKKDQNEKNGKNETMKRKMNKNVTNQKMKTKMNKMANKK